MKLGIILVILVNVFNMSLYANSELFKTEFRIKDKDYTYSDSVESKDLQKIKIEVVRKFTQGNPSNKDIKDIDKIKDPKVSIDLGIIFEGKAKLKDTRVYYAYTFRIREFKGFIKDSNKNKNAVIDTYEYLLSGEAKLDKEVKINLGKKQTVYIKFSKNRSKIKK